MSSPIKEEDFARKSDGAEDASSSNQKQPDGRNCKFFLQVQPYDTSRSEDDDDEQCVSASKRNGTTALKMNSLNARDRWGRLKTTMAVTNNMAVKKKGRLDRGDSFLRKFSTRNQEGVKEPSESDNPSSNDIHHVKHRTLGSYVIHPAGAIMFYWLGAVTVAVLYNLWTCIAREAFREIQEGYMIMWFCFDGVCDFVYVCDILVQFRTGYLQQGLMVYDSSKLCKNYVKHRCFLVDLACLVPLDFLQFYTGIHPMLRFPRFLKLYRGVTFMHMYESRTAYPNLLRVLNLSHILFLGSHWFAAFYYLISESEGFKGDWSYPKPDGIYSSVTRKYLASLYWSTLTLTTIGDLPQPDTNWQYVFVIVSYLIGVFIFATIVGQVGNVITNRNASRQEFERLLDGAKFYMQMHNVPTDLQKRVQRWYDYVWTRGRLNCNDINSLGLLPDKLKTELALHVNLGTLKKVTIFQKCRPEFLHDLMLKMRAYIFTPGDLICRRGEVAREMFIIADGVVEILGENATVLTQMSTGDFFGEIGILNLDGGINRRTADVRSVGYSELFVLSREDVLAALKDHPDAEQIIREYGQRRLKETEQHRKLARSVPNSPEPSTYRNTRPSNKSSKHVNNPSLNLPQVKYLQKFPQMSPKLRKVFNLKNRRKDSSRGKSEKCVEAVKSEKNGGSHENDKMNIYTIERDKAVPGSQLNTIKEGNANEQATPTEPGTGSCNIASVVINLLKQRRQTGYTAVETDENNDVFSEIKIENIADVTSGASSRKCVDMSHDSSVANNSCKSLANPGFRDRSPGDSISDVDIHHDVRQPDHKALFLPKIVLTKDSRQASSASSSSSNSGTEDAADDIRPPTPHPQHRDHITRKSSPCVLTLGPKLSDPKNRRISCPPPLDLPIPVPPFSNFRGLAQNEVTFALDRFQETLERRMERLESSYRDTVAKLEDSAKSQEQLIKVILQKLTLPSDKRKESAGLSASFSEEHSSSNKSVPEFRRKTPISSTPRLSKSSKLNCPSMHMSLDCSTNSSPILKHRSLSVDDDAFEESTVIYTPPKFLRDSTRSRAGSRSRNYSDRSDASSDVANEGVPISEVADKDENKLEENLEHITETEHISEDESKVTHF